MGGSSRRYLQVMEHLIMFINAHLALRFDNKLAIIASHADKSELVYSNEFPISSSPLDDRKPANVYKQFKEVDDYVIAQLKDVSSEMDTANPTQASADLKI
ncbi:RNA polymerase II transcription factor B subunit 4 [Blyttiomyces sp. JEL0837]|nr:RNA polymerase II transcription factor B subunit 4 [Blyttiomyces sp. JEL0837]